MTTDIDALLAEADAAAGDDKLERIKDALAALETLILHSAPGPDRTQREQVLARARAALREVKAERDRLRAAGVWLMHLVNDVGKAGGKPEPGEWEEAWDSLRRALDGEG